MKPGFKEQVFGGYPVTVSSEYDELGWPLTRGPGRKFSWRSGDIANDRVYLRHRYP
jgi:hypothetical protein